MQSLFVPEKTTGLNLPLELLTEVSNTTSSQALYNTLMSWLPRLFRCDRISLTLRHDEHHLRIVAYAGCALKGIDDIVPIAGSNVGACFLSQTAMVVNDEGSTVAQGAYSFKPITSGNKLRSAVILPLIAAGDCLGTLNFWSAKTTSPNQALMDEMLKMAAWIATQISHHDALERLYASEARFDALIENADAIIFAKNADGRMLIANRKFCDTFGIAPDDVVGRLDTEIFKPVQRADWYEEDRRLLKTLTSHKSEGELRLPDGSLRQFLKHKFPVYNPVRGEHVLCGIYTDITEQKDTERALRESEERFRAFCDHSPTMMYIKDTDHHLEYANREFMETFAAKETDLLGQPSHNRASSKEIADFKAMDVEVLASNAVVRRELQIGKGDGNAIDLIVTKFPIRDAQGKTVAIGGVNVDITEQKKIERTLREIEHRTRAFWENSPSMFYIRDLDWNFVLVNPAFLEFAGVTSMDAFGRHTVGVLSDTQQKAVRNWDNEVLRTRRTLRCEMRMTDVDKVERDFIVTKFPIYGADDEILGVGSIGTEITDLKNAERALRESEEQFRAFCEHSPTMMYIKDTDHAFRFVNRKFLDFIGGEESDFMGQQRAGAVATGRFSSLGELDDAVLETGETVQQNARLRDASGNRRSLIVTKFPIRGADGKTVGIGGVNTDVTELRNRERRLAMARNIAELNAGMAKQAAGNAREVERAKSEFMAALSDDIRAPLNAVIGLSGMLLNSDLDSKQQDQIEIIHQSSGALLALLNDILDLSQIETGRFSLVQTDFSIPILIDEIEARWRPLARRKGLRWVCEDAAGESLVVHGDPERTAQVLENLVSNAVKFTESGAIGLKMAQTVLPDGRIETRFEISDTGPGIDPECADNIFKSFRKVSPTDGYSNSGLGLAISKSLIDLMGGQIGFENRSDGGAIFWFTITSPPPKP